MTLSDAPSCPLCGSAPGRLVGTKDGLRVVRCSRCTVEYSERTPAPEDLPALYSEHYFHGDPAGYPSYADDEEIHRDRARAYLRDMHRLMPTPGRLLDVGCATGFFLDEARRIGWKVRGCEVSDWAGGYARQQLGLDVSLGAFPTADLAGERFDVVTFLNVFEQLPDAKEAAVALTSLVAPGGYLILETWDADALLVRLSGMRWHQYRPRDTPVYLNRRSLQVLFPAPHWSLVEFHPRTKWIRLDHGLHALGFHGWGGRNGNGHGRGEATARGPVSRALHSVVLPYRLGDLVWVVFRRNAG